MERLIETRRDFLKHASILSIPLLFGCNSLAQKAETDVLGEIRKNSIADPNCSWCGAREVPSNVSWRTKLSSEAEREGRILISGTVYKPDGKSLAQNTLIYLYHTDIYGIYGRAGEHRHGRYRGWMLTDEKGRYEFESIMPTSYPNSTIAAHIHMTVTDKDHKEDWVDSILFEGDRFITAQERRPQKGGFNAILKLDKGSDGVMRGRRDIQLG